MNANSFTHRLKEARERSGLSQKALGESIGIDSKVASSRINRYEKGTRQPNLDTLTRIAKVLKISPSYFCEPNDVIADFIFILSGLDDEKLDHALILLMKLNNGAAT
jgi:transcriptional regulator with XRE-family HTH domain